MIEFSELRDKLITKLQAIATPYDLNFHIVSDTGEYKKPDRVNNSVTDYTNAVIKLMASDISNLTDGSIVATINAKLDIIVRLPDITADESYNAQQFETITQKVDKVREVLTLLTQNNTFEEETDDNGIEFAISTIYQQAVTGERNIVANVGDAFTFTVYIYYIIIQGGLNTKNTVFNLDGAILPYQSMTINRAKTYDSNVYADTTDGAVQNVAIQSNWSVTFELPAIKSDFFNDLLDYLLGDESLNCVHCLRFTLGNTKKSFLVTLGDSNLNGETIKNLGLKITFFEAPKNYYLRSYPKSYKYYESTTDPFKQLSFNNGGFIVYESGNITYLEGETTRVIPQGGISGTIATSSELRLHDGYEELT